MVTPIFDINKSIQVILYVSNRLKRRDFHKIFKVIYFADRDHLSKYGRVITGDSYIAMTDGPVPSKIYDLFKIMRGDGLFSAENRNSFVNDFEVSGGMFIVPKRDANLRFLSESEIEALDESLKEYGLMTWDKIREESHNYAWHNTIKDQTISLKDILLESEEEDEYINFILNKVELQKACL